ncbi:hypothetical protein PF010_g30071 [Phytophthora fragariae]|uniref:Uncharacterized protein n=1 Tax=Phytophthora fragariae TaxID=53985 RepID=A0A6A4APF0_9STRA|nr:hypothetical protein PF003_g21369 [Phytophthora fragariae]KAE9060803.1 hypothetical protein PF010_g30071 [Phytophthora fragariae]KAE9060837.1 hypothetical protein PF006_g31552 [Phytophthora fragariae]KAE9261683.1 hypothetical protein PF001_g32331 [Phytophthora fragariae]
MEIAKLVRSAVTNYTEDHRLARRELRQHLARVRGEPDRAEPGVLVISVLEPELEPELELMKASAVDGRADGPGALEEAGHVTVDFLGGRTDGDRGERRGARGDQGGP